MRWSSLLTILLVACQQEGATEPSTDGGPVDASMDAGLCALEAPPDLEGCALDVPNAALVGTTPLGPVDLRYARAATLDGCGEQVVVGPDPALTFPSSRYRVPRLIIELGDAPRDAPVRDVTVTYAGGDCEQVTAEGTLEVEQLDSAGDRGTVGPGDADGWCACEADPPAGFACEGEGRRRVVGRLVVDAEGWSLEGMLDAAHCHALHGWCF